MKAIMTTTEGTKFEVTWDETTPVIKGLEGERLETFRRYLGAVHPWPVADVPRSRNSTAGFTVEERVAGSDFEIMMLCASSPSNIAWVTDMQSEGIENS